MVLFSRQIEKRERERAKKRKKEKGQEKIITNNINKNYDKEKVLCMYATNIDKIGCSLFSLSEYI